MRRALIVLATCAVCTSAFGLTVSDHVKINEIYFAGSTGGTVSDGFIELYNAGSQTAYLDGALLLQGTDSFAQLAFQFPGNPGGTAHPLAPGAFAVVAIDAHNFSSEHPWGLDLSAARFETFWTFEPEPRDNPAAANLLGVMGVPFDWFFDAEHGQVVLATGDEWTVIPAEEGETCGGVACTVPPSDVVDGVEFSYQPHIYPPRLSNAIDAGLIAGIPPGSGQSVERVTPGHDTNNSTFDFVARLFPTPGYQASLAADVRPPMIALSVEFDAIYPNPFNSETRLTFKLPEPGHVQLVVYDILGNPVRTLLSGRLDAGEHETTWDGTGDRGILPTGVYIARLAGAGGEAVRKIVLSR